MKAGRVVMIVIGALIALMGFGLLVGGAGALAGYATHRDDDGFFRTPEVRLASPTYAIVSDRIDLSTRPGPSDWLMDRGTLGTVKLTLDPAEPQTPVFAGIGPSRDVAAYLDGVSRDQIRDVDVSPNRVRYRRREGEAVPALPGQQPFWVEQITTDQTSELTWKVESGDWTVVVMNADASRGIDVDTRLGIKVGWFLPAAIGAAIGGLILLAGGTVLAIAGGRGLARAEEPVVVEGAAAPAVLGTAPTTGTWAAPMSAPAGERAPPGERAYPLRLTGRLDPTLSRGLWLVKWLLAIPHYIVLVFLWIAFWVVVIIAFFAILFTGRYPRRCSGSTSGCCAGAGASASTPSARSAPTATRPSAWRPADYPATLDVEYPERLSRGLIFVKWWLLAIPHYLVLGLFGTGWWLGWSGRDGRWAARGGFGLLGLLVLFAGISLLFRGRYPRGIFAFVMGLNRWLYRVAAYVTLMTDRYPPFRLDQGGEDATILSEPPPPAV